MKRIINMMLIAFTFMAVLQSCNKDDFTFKSPEYRTFNSVQKKLWSEHMQYTYTTVDAFFHNSNSLDSHLGRLLLNQEHIGESMVPYYGQSAGDQLTELLKEHIMLAVPVLTAAQEGDEPGLEVALDDWYINAREIGDFLGDANPDHWEKQEMRDMMEMHIDQTVAYSVDLLTENYQGSLEKFQEAFDHMQEMADHITDGIAKQFPKKFKK